MREGAFDSQNVAFWSASERCYVLYLRTWTGGGFRDFRTISRSTSTHFLNWSKPLEMTFGDTPREHLYTSQTQTGAITFDGRELVVNFSTGAAGRLRVKVQDAAGKPLPGFTLADAVDQIGDEIERVVSWKSGLDVGRLAGTPVRLRFVMQDADLFALRFR